jgi:hypothetical protein
MNEVLRQRLWRHIDALPEERIYQVLDYIEFLSSKYARESVRPPTSSLQKFGERLEDAMRVQGVATRAMRGALDAVGTADRVFGGLAEASRSLLREVDSGLQNPSTDSAPARIPPPREEPSQPEIRSDPPPSSY